jgi:hypothetical protein
MSSQPTLTRSENPFITIVPATVITMMVWPDSVNRFSELAPS